MLFIWIFHYQWLSSEKCSQTVYNHSLSLVTKAVEESLNSAIMNLIHLKNSIICYSNFFFI